MQPLTLIIFAFWSFFFMFLGDFCKLSKTPSNGTCLGEPLGGFCDVGFYLTRGFSFITFWRYPSPFCELTPGFYNHFILSAQLIAEWFVALSLFCAFPSQFFSKRYGFERAFFTHKYFLPCIPSLHFCHVLLLRCGQEHPIQDPSLCLPSRSCPFRLMHGLELLIL